MTGELRGHWVAPRWANVSRAIKNAAHINGVECSIEVDKGWIRESGRYTLRGDQNVLQGMARAIMRAVEGYNK